MRVAVVIAGIVSGLLGWGCGGEDASSDARPPASSAHSLDLLMGRIGPVGLTDPKTKVLKELGEPPDRSIPFTFGYGDAFVVFDPKGNADHFGVLESGQTTRGLRAGDDASRIEELYPELECTKDEGTEDEGAGPSIICVGDIGNVRARVESYEMGGDFEVDRISSAHLPPECVVASGAPPSPLPACLGAGLLAGG
jgi:hypothetical protein